MSAIDGRFHLVNHDGREVSETDFRGLFMLVFFGFTHCRVVCPRALARISNALDRIGTLADKVQPLYVSVDPARDTPAVMKEFLERNYPRFLGLTGTAQQIEDARRSFRVFAQRQDDPGSPDGYVVPHSAMTYLLGPTGNYLAHFAESTDEVQLSERLRELLARG